MNKIKYICTIVLFNNNSNITIIVHPPPHTHTHTHTHAPLSQPNQSTENKESVKECILCSSKANQQTRYNSWGKLECTYLEKYLGASTHSKSSACNYLKLINMHGHDQDHVPSWKTMPPNDDLQSKRQCSNPHTM